MPAIRIVLFAGVFGTLALPQSAAQPPADEAARVVARWDQFRRAAPVVKYALRWELFPADPKPGDLKPGAGRFATG
jgi:hypothetical protein